MVSRITFHNDDDVECDCGCTVSAGDSYAKVSVTVCNRDKQMRTVNYTSCLYEDHMAIAFWNKLHRNEVSIDERYIQTAEDKGYECAEQNSD